MSMANKHFERQRKIHDGAIAETALSALGDTFTKTREILVDQLVKNTKADGKPDEFTVYQLTALEDVRIMLSEQIRTGRRAAEARRKELEQNAGGSEV